MWSSLASNLLHSKSQPRTPTFLPLPSKYWNYTVTAIPGSMISLGSLVPNLFSEPYTAPNMMTEKLRKRKYKKDFRPCVVVCIVTLATQEAEAGVLRIAGQDLYVK